MLCLAVNGLDSWPPASPSALPHWLHTGAAAYPKALLSPQCLSQASMVPLLPQGLPELLQSIQPVSLLSEALFVQFEPDGIVVPCIGFT